ncbi:hypothetical protein NQ318_004513 [Aromia moschata]|uniref:UDP-glucuronosyltransferase n=1 Tax=Aromia moschata TaxID=1265417 RepID=A0AAV8Y6B5_9CUCU|nr:hypothetical protein NQ318_004513 [Aromia moschata]
MFKFLAIVILFVYATPLCAYNILGIFPHLGKSHFDAFRPLMKGLAQKGHSVTVMSHFPLTRPFQNYRDIDLGGKNQVFIDVVDIKQEDPSSRLKKILNVWMLADSANLSCEVGLSSSAVQNFLKTEEQFDVMIVEFFNSDCFLGLVQKVKAPVIGITSGTMMPWNSKRFANPTHTAYIPNNNMDYSDSMTFLERLENTVVTLYHEIYYEYVVVSRDERVSERYLGVEPGRIRDFIRNSSLLLTNSHFSLTLPRPLVPNVVEIGGLHIEKTKSVPEFKPSDV